MVAVKKVICSVDDIPLKVKELMSCYNSIKVCMRGSDEHTKLRLKDDVVLIKAWNRRVTVKKWK